ncbi:MAG TPA: phosphatase PAP2 family protein [Actinomycetes bacterium]|nr:phosphatase PAP2 family protein [Actinomycetes bacterium]
MPHLMLGWRIALAGALALVLAAGLLALFRPQGRRGRVAVAAVRECGIVLGLFAVWQLAGTFAHHNATGAGRRGQEILDAEADLHLPSEHWVQHLIQGHDTVSQFCNAFYIYGHFNGLIIFLAWIFLRHRQLYPSVRMSVVLLTAGCFLFHLFLTVAPPRLLPHGGFVDTAAVYGQSVYGPTTIGLADQLSAFPSVHVGWATLVAWYAWRASPWRWGWVGVAHFVLTTFVVVATANHYWLDGFVAMGIFAVALLLQATVPMLVRASRSRPPQPEPVEEPALV